jgi:hypothetical protein
MKKLGGWYRLWVVISLIYLLIVSLFAWLDWPKQSKIEKIWAYDLINVIKEPGQYSYEIRLEYSDMSDKELIKRIQDKFGEDIKYKKLIDEVNQQNLNKIDKLFDEQKEAFFTAFLWWIIPIMFLYLLGVAVGWIYRGFKS